MFCMNQPLGTKVVIRVKPSVSVQTGVGVVTGVKVAVAVAVAVAVEVAVGDALGVGLGVGVAQTPQLPLTFITRCMFGKPIDARFVGLAMPQSAALI